MRPALLRAWSAGPAAPLLAIVLTGLVASAGCQNVAEPATTHEISTTAPATSAADYPSLYSVPPRPQLSYSVQQRRAIVDGLIADRTNARYTDQVVRYRTGRSSLPPPPAPPPVVVPDVPVERTAPRETAAPQEQAPEATSGGITPGGSGQDTLGDFVNQMVHDTEQPATGDGAAAAGEAKSGGSGFFGWLRGLFGQAAEPAPRASALSSAAGPPAADPVGAVADRAPVEGGPPPAADAALAALVAQTRPAFEPAAGPAPAARLEQAMAPGPADQPQAAAGVHPVGQRLAAAESGASAQPNPGSIGIAIGVGEIAIEGRRPAPKPAGGAASAGTPAAVINAARTTRAAHGSAAGTPAGLVGFAPGSAELPAGISPELEQVLTTARRQGARIRIVGEADAAALALDRARAVAIALVHLGARAGDLEMQLAPHATGDQARLLLAPAAR